MHLCKRLGSFIIHRQLVLTARFNANLRIMNKVLAQSKLSFSCKIQQFKEGLIAIKVGKECEIFHGCAESAPGLQVVVRHVNLALFQLRYKRPNTIYCPWRWGPQCDAWRWRAAPSGRGWCLSAGSPPRHPGSRVVRPRAKRRKSRNRRWSARCSVLLDKNPEPSWQGIVVLSTEEAGGQALLIDERLYIFTWRGKGEYLSIGILAFC